MPQFDILYFALLSFIIFLICIYLFFVAFSHMFNTLFKIKMFQKNYNDQKTLILTIKNEIAIKKAARISWIKKNTWVSWQIIFY